ncbi:MAG: nucleotidyltransferase domain-containing protein [Saprospiraceae bacterium]|jgi:predicted nucleotidyltransferase|nr:nucleotidyltransferase domain-containing protein [Saprospiraceae bacterium]
MKKRDKILQAAKQRLTAKFGEQIKDVVLFGSQAWGKPSPTSDWDFVVVVRGEYDWRTVQSIRYVMADLDMDYDVFTQTLVVSESELQNSTERYEPVFTKALSQGIYAA